MNATRLPKVIIGAALVIAALVVFQAVYSSGNARQSNRSYVGMGDLQRYEAQQEIHYVVENNSYVGMGDLHRYEAQQEIQYAEKNNSYVGMGDLRRYEAQQEMQYAGENKILSH